MNAVGTAIKEILFDRIFIAVLVLAVASALLLYGIKGGDAVRAALEDDLRLFALLAFFVPAVLFLSANFEVLTPRAVIERWLGAGAGLKGILIATVAGMFTPGGPWLAFPVVLALRRAGADWGPLVAYVTSWSLLSVTRILVFEIPLVGLDFVAVRYPATVLLPVLAGVVAGRIARVYRPPGRDGPQC